MEFKFRYDFAQNNPPRLQDAYVNFVKLPVPTLEITGGRFKAPLGLDGYTGSDDTGSNNLSDLPGEGTIEERIVQQMVDSGYTEEEAQCLLDGLGTGLTGDSGPSGNTLEVFEECGIDLARLSELTG